MAEIKTEKQAVEAMEKGFFLYDMPEKFRKLESVTLAAVKKRRDNLQNVDTQTSEICLAAFQEHGEEVLKYVDPELRTVALLKACGIDVEEYDYFKDGKFRYISDVSWGDADTTAVYELFIKGEAETLPYAQKLVSRILDEYCHEDEWKDIWCNNPADADEYSLEFAPDNKSFTMSFNFGIDSNDADPIDFAYFATDRVLDHASEILMGLKIFLSVETESEYGSSCQYWIFDTDGDDFTKENKEWQFNFAVYEFGASREANSLRSIWIRSRRNLWLLEDTGDKDAIKKAKEELDVAEKKATEFEETNRSDE